MTASPADIIIRCAICTTPIDAREIELNEECQIVCRECYLSDVPECDIAGVLHDLESTAVTGLQCPACGKAAKYTRQVEMLSCGECGAVTDEVELIAAQSPFWHVNDTDLEAFYRGEPDSEFGQGCKAALMARGYTKFLAEEA